MNRSTNQTADRNGLSEYRIAVLISGGGTTLRNLLEARERGELSATIQLVISSNSSAAGLRFAEDAAIPQVVFDHHEYRTAEGISNRIFDACRAAGVDLVVCGGFLRRLKIPSDFEGRVINIHPSLIPKFCGKGMYGSRVHAEVLAAGEKQSGCTVHFVDDQFDHGPVIAARTVEVKPDDTVPTLAARVFRIECELYPAVINQFARGEITVGK